MQTLNVRIKNRHNTSSYWEAQTTFVPLSGELIIYDDLHKIKAGDGSTTVVNLPFIVAEGGSSGDSKYIEYSTYSALPSPGTTGILCLTKDTNKLYRWDSTNTTYVEVVPVSGKANLVTGAINGNLAGLNSNGDLTDSGISANGIVTSVNTHTGEVTLTKSDLNLENVGNFKSVSTVANQNLEETEKLNARTNIGAGTSSFSGSYNDLSDKPSIPSEVTESTVSGWGFTKNTGTITQITMNGESKGTSGSVDLGTVITAHQDISGKQDKITATGVLQGNGSGSITEKSVDSTASSGSSNLITSDAVYQATNDKQTKLTTVTVTLLSSGWSNKTCTATVSGVTASNTVFISPATTSVLKWCESQVYCSAQDTDTLTFTCVTTPSENLIANVVIFN